jgi:hypothetical protein
LGLFAHATRVRAAGGGKTAVALTLAARLLAAGAADGISLRAY